MVISYHISQPDSKFCRARRTVEAQIYRYQVGYDTGSVSYPVQYRYLVDNR
jgi:hypothetical protein